MHHQTDTLHPSEFFSIYPTLISMFDLKGYHPAEEPKVQGLINSEQSPDVLDTLPLLKKSINDCIKAHTNEYGIEYHEIKDSVYEVIKPGEGIESKKFDNDVFVGYYWPHANKDDINLIIEPPYDNPIKAPVDKTVSIYTAPSEKFIIDKARVIITPAHLARYITPNASKTAVDMITFTTKVVDSNKITYND